MGKSGGKHDLKREIWFKKVLWSYMPCNLTGLLLICGLVFIGVGGVFVGQWVLRAADVDGADDWPFLLIIPTVISGWIIAERHS